MRNSSRKSVSGISKDGDGEVSTITPLSASPPTVFWSPKRGRFPPRDLIHPGGAKCLPYPKFVDPKSPPLRPQRHIPNSIATLRCRLISALVKNLPRCPCCHALVTKIRRGNLSCSSTKWLRPAHQFIGVRPQRLLDGFQRVSDLTFALLRG